MLEGRNGFQIWKWTLQYLDHLWFHVQLKPSPATWPDSHVPEMRGQGVHAKNTPDQGLLLRNRQTSWKPGMRRGIERGRSEHYVVPSQRDEQDAVTRDEIQPLGGACEGMQVLDARSSTLVCRQDQVNNFNKSDTRLPSFGLVTSNGAVTRRDSDCNSSLGKTT